MYHSMYSLKDIHESRKLKQARPYGRTVDLLRGTVRLLLPHGISVRGYSSITDFICQRVFNYILGRIYKLTKFYFDFTL